MAATNFDEAVEEVICGFGHGGAISAITAHDQFKVARNNLDAETQLTALQRAHENFVNEALFLFVAHDAGPRALLSRAKGFVQA